MKPCRYFRITPAVTVEGVSLASVLGFCGRPGYYRDSLGRPLCEACASEVQSTEEGDVVFGPAGRRLLIAPVH